MSNIDTIKVLRNARKLIEKPGAWVKGRYRGRRDEFGRFLDDGFGPYDCWCLAGAIENASDYRPGNAYEVIREAIGECRRGLLAGIDDDIVEWNDRKSRKHAQVLNVLDKAIAILEKSGK